MSIAVIIVHYGDPSVTRASLIKLAPKLAGSQLILINNTRDNLAQLAQIVPRTRLINNKKNLGFARAVNQGITLALAEGGTTHLLLLNNDLHLSYGTLKQLLSGFDRHPKAGIISPILHHSGGYDWGGRYNRFWGLVRHTNWDSLPKTTLAPDHVAGAAMLISRTLVEQIGLFDERFFLYYEDLDFCLRAKDAGYTIHLNPQVVAEHTVSAASSPLTRTLRQWRSHLVFVAKHLPVRALPTALLTDLIFYPLIVLKSFLVR